MVAKDFLTYVLRDDATPYGGVSFHGETLGDFLAETDFDENSDMDAVNSALIECGIMPVPFDGMMHAFRVEGRDGMMGDGTIVMYYMVSEAAVKMAETLVALGSEATVTDTLADRGIFSSEKNLK